MLKSTVSSARRNRPEGGEVAPEVTSEHNRSPLVLQKPTVKPKERQEVRSLSEA